MSIRSRQKLMDKVTKIGSALIILSFISWIGFNTYEDRQSRVQVAEVVEELQREVESLHDFIDDWSYDQEE